MYKYNKKLLFIILMIIFFIIYKNYYKEKFINDPKIDWSSPNLSYGSTRNNNYYKIENTNYPGNNINVSKVDDIIDCGRKCNMKDNCIGFTYKKKDNICSLKKYIGNSIITKNYDTYKRTDDTTNISFDPDQTKYIFANKVVWNKPINNLSKFKDLYHKCNIKCNLNSDCVGYNINNDKTCELKNNMEGRGTITNNTNGSFIKTDYYNKKKTIL